MRGTAREGGSVRLAVRLTPGASNEGIDGPVDGVLRARVTARPVDGAANEALLRLLAAELGVPRRRLDIRRGATNRVKVIEIEGVDADALRSRWPGLDV